MFLFFNSGDFFSQDIQGFLDFDFFSRGKALDHFHQPGLAGEKTIVQDLVALLGYLQVPVTAVLGVFGAGDLA